MSPRKQPRRDPRSGPADIPLPFPASDARATIEAEEDAFALLRLFYFRRILDHQALSLLVQNYRSLSEFFSASERELRMFFASRRHLRGYVDAAQLVSPAQRAASLRYAEKQQLWMEKRGRLLVSAHPDFPAPLDRSRYPIDWLFFYPRVPRDMGSPVVTIIGSRESTPDQLAAAREVALHVGAIGGTVVTGLATGADAAAHAAARDTEATIIAVLGSGIGKVYPPQHQPWVRELLGGRGYVLTEVPPDYSANADAFVLRNRIAAGLSDVVVAASGRYTSGTAHTIRYAADASVPVVSVDPEPSSGISKLVRDLGGTVTDPATLALTLGRRIDNNA